MTAKRKQPEPRAAAGARALPRARARVRAGLFRALVLCSALVVCAALVLALVVPTAAQAQHRITRSAQLDHDGEFRSWNLAGSVRVIGWDVDSVRVEADLDDDARDVFLFGADGEGGKLTTDDAGRSGVAHLVVHVPRGSTIWIKTMSAPVHVSGVTGTVDVYAVTGDVRIDASSAATVYAESMGGRVRVTGSARVVRLRSGSGFLDFDGSATDLMLTTVSGDIRARAAGVLRGVVESVGGTVHLGVSFGPAATLEVLTHDGDLDLTLPAGASAAFELRSVSGDIELFEPFARAAGRGDAGRHVVFSTRGGDAVVELRTFSGDIRVRGAVDGRRGGATTD